MPKAAPGSRVSARLNTPGAEGVGEDGLLGEQTEGEAVLEAVGELDGKFEEWHLQAKHDAAVRKGEYMLLFLHDPKELVAVEEMIGRKKSVVAKAAGC